MADEAVCHGPRQRTGLPLHPAQVDRWRLRRRVGPRVEVRLHPGDAVVGALVGGCHPRGERGERGAQGTDVVTQPADRVLAEGDGIAVFDVLADLCPETQLEPPAAELSDVPCRIGEERRAAGEGERHAGADGDPLGVLGGEERHRHGVVHRLGHVQPAVAQPLDPLGVGDGLGQAQARVHARVDLHVGVPSSPVVCARPRATIFSRSVLSRDWSKRSAIHWRDHAASALNASRPLSAPILS